MSSDVKAGGGEPRRWTLVDWRQAIRLGIPMPRRAVDEDAYDAVVAERDERDAALKDAMSVAEGFKAERDAARAELEPVQEHCYVLDERVRVLTEALETCLKWVSDESGLAPVIAAALASVADSDPEGACPDCNGKGGEHEDRGGLTSEAVPCQTCGGTASPSSGGVTPEGRGERITLVRWREAIPAPPGEHNWQTANPWQLQRFSPEHYEFGEFERVDTTAPVSSAAVDEGGEADGMLKRVRVPIGLTLKRRREAEERAVMCTALACGPTGRFHESDVLGVLPESTVLCNYRLGFHRLAKRGELVRIGVLLRRWKVTDYHAAYEAWCADEAPASASGGEGK